MTCPKRGGSVTMLNALTNPNPHSHTCTPSLWAFLFAHSLASCPVAAPLAVGVNAFNPRYGHLGVTSLALFSSPGYRFQRFSPIPTLLRVIAPSPSPSLLSSDDPSNQAYVAIMAKQPSSYGSPLPVIPPNRPFLSLDAPLHLPTPIVLPVSRVSSPSFHRHYAATSTCSISTM